MNILFFRIYLKKTAYKYKEVAEEIDIDINDLLKDIDNYEIVALKGKEFNLYKRLYFIFHE
jgi:hypothetical protein